MTVSRWSQIGGAMMALGLVTATSAAADDDYEWPRFINVITPIVGTANHSLAVAWTSEFSAQTGSRARVLPAPNGFTRVQWLNTDEGRIAMLQASDYFDQMDGVEGFASPMAGPADTRVANMNMVTPWGYMVRGDSDIQSITDIGPGTRISFSPSSSFLVAGVNALLAYNGLDASDVELVEVGNYGANTRIVVEGRADVTFTSPLSGPSYEAEAAPSGVRWLALPDASADPEAFARYRAFQPGYVPRETVAGVTSSIGVPMDHAFQANHVRADEDEELVYQLLKWLTEEHESFREAFTHANMMSVDSLVAFIEAGALQPLHPGAIRYLEEIGVWTPAYQAHQDALVEMAQTRVALFEQAVADAQAQGIDTNPENAAWVEFWQQALADAGVTQSYGEMVLALP